MRRRDKYFIGLIGMLFLISSCKKNKDNTPDTFSVSFTVNNSHNGFNYVGVSTKPAIQFTFTEPVQTESFTSVVTFTDESNNSIPYNTIFSSNNTIAVIQPVQSLSGLSQYVISAPANLLSVNGGKLLNPATINLTTTIDSTDKYPRISDDSLLTIVQKQTFKYFWDFGHPVSGCARERNTSGDVITTGGTGFGVMAMLAAVSRGFITRTDALNRIVTITNFYKNKCTAYHGAYSHWINGATGATVPFSTQDDGADLVETSYLMQGLLCARQYFDGNDAGETALRASINQLWDAVDWNWFQQGGQDVLYWHWSPNFGWAINQKIEGWNEALIVYALAASSRTHPVAKAVYDSGWARNGAIKNGKQFYNLTLPLGDDYGGPLFFAHYSFLGIYPRDLSDDYATDYWQQNVAHTDINYLYCISNPKGYAGYSDECWGLTASDEQNGYSAHSPTNDNGTITPTAAISSLPYDSVKCMAALRFFYYKLGDKLWGDYGFKDAFNLTENWFADSYLAIDQGPQIVMIENLRNGLLWSLFMSCPEVRTGMKNIGFQSPYLN